MPNLTFQYCKVCVIISYIITTCPSFSQTDSQSYILTPAQREAIFQEAFQIPRMVKGGTIQARWLPDGSSFCYRHLYTELFFDPANPAEDNKPHTASSNELKEAKTPTQPSPRNNRIYNSAKTHYITTNKGNMILHNTNDNTEQQLTHDDENEFTWLTSDTCWSPDNISFFAIRLDIRNVHRIPIVDYTKPLEAVDTSPYFKTGSPFAEFELIIFNIETGSKTSIDLGPSITDIYILPIGWRETDNNVIFLRMDREAKKLDLITANPTTGTSRVILTEVQEKTFVGGLDFITGGYTKYYTPITGTDNFLWLSDRDGWRHVYLYNYQGKLIRQITRGQFPVVEVATVDTERNRIFVRANAEARLYDTNLYRVNFDGSEFLKLTQANGEHNIQISPSKLYFIDNHSSVKQSPVSELRTTTDGTLITELSRADISQLQNTNWQPPEEFIVKAADNTTDLYGVLYKPHNFDPGKKYPIIDLIYSGPFMTIVPNEYMAQSYFPLYAHALAQMGFIVFMVDPRGTTERSKAFQDASYCKIGQIVIPDHVATLNQLAKDHPYIDLDRVGVYGHSWGGYFALRAMLTAPDTFHVGIAGAPGDLTESAPINEPYMRTPQNNPEGYAAGSNPAIAANLKGKLLLIHGTADINAPFSTTMRMVNALIKAGKQHDLCVFPGGTHRLQGAQAKYERELITSYFLNNLSNKK